MGTGIRPSRLYVLFCLASLFVLLPTKKDMFAYVSRPEEYAALSPRSTPDNFDFAACLMVMDDSHFLAEWLAYHYHAVRLRKVIVAMDPNSQTSSQTILDRWKNYSDLQIHFWENEEDYVTNPSEFEQTLLEVKNSSGPSLTPSLSRFRARQRLFYFKCLLQLKQQDYQWTLLTDTDEFLTLNYDALTDHEDPFNGTQLLTPNIPGFVSNFIIQEQKANIQVPKTSIQRDSPLLLLQSSPCVHIPRLLFGAKEDEEKNRELVLPGLLPEVYRKDLSTSRWKYHAAEDNDKVNKIAKVLLDLSRIPEKEIVLASSIHLPVQSCQQRRFQVQKSQSFLVLHHYLGSQEQYLFRERDARQDQRSREQFQQQSSQANIPVTNKELDIVRWIEGFVKHPPSQNTNTQSLQTSMSTSLPPPQYFLQDVGKLQPKSWTTYLGDPNQERCAMCFFGLPRAFKALVLPSIVQNILIPNARHNCDIFVHYYEIHGEEEGRRNPGGTINPDEIYELKTAAEQIHNEYGPKDPNARTYRSPTIMFTKDTNDTFWEKRGPAVKKYQNAKRPDNGKLMYYPYKEKTYRKSSIENIVKQWHSIDCVFELLNSWGSSRKVNYTRVAMFRSDVMYAFPVDLALLDNGVTDTYNQFVAVPGFGRFPVNDRMIYGKYEGVKVWATQRFAFLEERARLNSQQGFVMHSERLMSKSVFPAIKKAILTPVQVNNDICFLRTRADESVIISDCSSNGTTRGWDKVNKIALVRRLTGRNCTALNLGQFAYLRCGIGINYR